MPSFVDFSELIEARMAEYGIPGVALGVCKDGHTTTAAFGVTNVEDPQPVTADTVFPIASISKTITATAMMRLVDQGKVELKAPVRRYLPAFSVQDHEASRHVTIWHLLTHTPGWEGQLHTIDRGDDTLRGLVEDMHALPQLADPGSVWSYNNTGFGVAGRVIEVVTGKPIHKALQELVFTPMGLAPGHTRPGERLNYSFAAPHRRNAKGGAEVLPAFDLPLNVTAGGVATTLASVITFGRLHIGDGSAADGTRVLSRASIELMRTPQIRKNATEDDMGVGWHLRRVGGLMTAAHGGTLDGHCLLLELVPERNLVFAVLTNHRDGWRLIQDVERETLKLYEGVSLARNQAVGHRGVNEAMNAHSSPLPTQPDVAEYVGAYHRPPLGRVVVTNESETLTVSGTPGAGPAKASIVFYGPDAAYATSGTFVGSPFEFIRTSSGEVGWLRINGRIARKVEDS